MFIPIEKKQNKKANYEVMVEHVAFYLVKSDSQTTNLANLSAYINYFLDDVNWVGFYLYNGEKLILGPFQGLPACTEIQLGSGVCGISALEQKTMIVEDVNVFPGHIACDGNSASEIVIPIIKNNQLIGVLDIDSPTLSRFTKIDAFYLEEIINKLVDIL